MKAIYVLVGMKHRGSEDFVRNLPAGEPLTLRREPTNEYDRNAVQVWGREKMLGYVKGTQARGLAAAMDRAGGGDVVGKLSITPDRWPMVEVNE